jgi:hypothetical protein
VFVFLWFCMETSVEYQPSQDEGARVALAVIAQLGPLGQLQVLDRLRELVEDDERGSRHDRDERRAVRALREAAELWAEQTGATHLPVDAYRQLRREHTKLRWPADTSIRSWIGPGWNDALASAGLEEAPEADLVLLGGIGPKFLRHECRQAILDYVEDTGVRLPSFRALARWAKRPEVEARPGHRPKSEAPYRRIYTTLANALADAGLLGDELAAHDIVATGHEATASPTPRGGYSADQLRGFLNEVAVRLGRSPTSGEFIQERVAIRAEECAAGLPLRAFAAYQTYQSRYATWDDALRDAGLEPVWDRRGTGRGNDLTNDGIAQALREAYELKGEPFTAGVYKRYRKAELERDPSRRLLRRLPDYNTIWQRFRSFDAACDYAGLERVMRGGPGRPLVPRD